MHVFACVSTTCFSFSEENLQDIFNVLNVDILNFVHTVPDAAPQNVTALTKSSTQITVTWQNVIGKHRNGIINGFKIFYQATGEFAENKTEHLLTVNNGSADLVVLTGLEKYIEYNISVLAFTSKGDGPNSTEVTATTDQDGMAHLICYNHLS